MTFVYILLFLFALFVWSLILYSAIKLYGEYSKNKLLTKDSDLDSPESL